MSASPRCIACEADIVADGIGLGHREPLPCFAEITAPSRETAELMANWLALRYREGMVEAGAGYSDTPRSHYAVRLQGWADETRCLIAFETDFPFVKRALVARYGATRGV